MTNTLKYTVVGLAVAVGIALLSNTSLVPFLPPLFHYVLGVGFIILGGMIALKK